MPDADALREWLDGLEEPRARFAHAGRFDMEPLAEAYPKEQARCRELLEVYRSLGPSGALGAARIENTLREADRAAMSGDIAQMIVAFKAMREHK